MKTRCLLLAESTLSLFIAHFVPLLHNAVVSEWLRSWTRNPMGYARTGSNPVHSGLFAFLFSYHFPWFTGYQHFLIIWMNLIIKFKL
jgi:hypothetical protein